MRTANKTLDRMTRSAVSRTFQSERPWRAPRHRSALRSTSSGAHRAAWESLDPVEIVRVLESTQLARTAFLPRWFGGGFPISLVGEGVRLGSVTQGATEFCRRVFVAAALV